MIACLNDPIPESLVLSTTMSAEGMMPLRRFFLIFRATEENNLDSATIASIISLSALRSVISKCGAPACAGGATVAEFVAAIERRVDWKLIDATSAITTTNERAITLYALIVRIGPGLSPLEPLLFILLSFHE
jgi:hypothetical protein